MKNLGSTLVLIACLVAPALASAGDIVKKPSSHGVQDTMDRFEKLVKSKGMKVFLRVDHQENASGVNMKMSEAQVLIFGNPKGGTVLMKDDIAASLDLPLRVAVYKDSAGKVWLSYHNPQGMKDDYAIKGGAKVLTKVEGALDKLTSAVTK